jgi:hypothetical protein
MYNAIPLHEFGHSSIIIMCGNDIQMLGLSLLLLAAKLLMFYEDEFLCHFP